MTDASTHRILRSTFWNGIFAVVIGTLSIFAFFWHDSKRAPHDELRTILSSDLTSSAVVSRLNKYVALGDDIDTVRQQLVPATKRTQHNGRPTEWALAMGDASLVLAIDQEGKVVGIGRHRPTDDGTIWLTGPEWDRVKPSSDALADNMESKQ